MAAPPTTRTLHGAVASESVRLLQRALNSATLDAGVEDGIYGPQTAAAVRRFQRSQGMPEDGIVGPQTWAVIAKTTPAGEELLRTTLRGPLYGATGGPDVRAAQEALLARGFSPGALDGIYGPSTARAVTEFQSKHGLRADGVVDAATWDALMSAAEEREQSSVAGPQDEKPPPTQPEPPALARKSTLPGFAADSTAGVDLLGVQDRVNFLASALAARQLETPLAVGIFGDWGSGKSFFMQRLQERIAKLAAASAQAEERKEESFYCSHVRQVTFNAWLYSDSDIWPSLAAKIFDSVTRTDTTQRDLPSQHLSAFQEREQSQVRKAEEEREQAAREEAAFVERIGELDREIASKRAALAEQAVPPAGAAAQTNKVLGGLAEMLTRLRRIGRTWRRLRPRDVLLLLLPLAAAAVAWVWSTQAAVILAVLTPLVPVIVGVVRYVDESTQLRVDVRELEERRELLQAEREEQVKRRTEAAGRVAEARKAPLLPEFASEQAARWLGRESLGVVTEIRLAFERLSELINEGCAARTPGSAPSADHLPIDRVVVYIDDLDRCSHDVVISVLESVKLLLDLPHFVVVVGVDSRWLFRSIQVHFADVLRTNGDRPDETWAATPQNYLEKIFQYSIVLRRLDATGFARLIDSLLPTSDGPPAARTPRPAPEPPPSGPGPGGSAPEPTPPAPVPAEAELDLTPDDLVITSAELAFMKGLASLFETPRAAKRLANVYRLVRVSVGAERLTDHENYEPVLVLLSVAMSFPALATELLRVIRANEKVSWDKLVASLGAFTRPAKADPARPYKGAFVGAVTEVEAATWHRLADALRRINHDEVADRTLADFVEWIDVVGDFSFHPWQELLPAETRG